MIFDLNIFLWWYNSVLLRELRDKHFLLKGYVLGIPENPSSCFYKTTVFIKKSLLHFSYIMKALRKNFVDQFFISE